MLSVIIPASNEESYLGACLASVLDQTLDPASCGGAEIIVSANACRDGTVAVAEGFADRAAARGWDLVVLDSPAPGKPGALNRADAAARGDLRVYLDADVVMDRDLLAALVAVLDTPAPRYASGRLRVTRAQTWVTRRFADIWVRLPFMTHGVPGAGLFAVNAAGRARWDDFPPIISDDTYVRLQFTPAERVGVAPGYDWPMIEGFAGLVKVRRRQDAGVAEIARLWPDLMAREGKPRLGLSGAARLALAHPVAFAVYVTVLMTVRMGGTAGAGSGAWTRGR